MRLLEPLLLGSPDRSHRPTAPSRVMFGPHETNLGRGRAFSERHVAYYARRAAGGAGIIVTEEASVHPSDWPYERCPSALECGPGWRDIAEACRPAVVLAAIGHSGGQGAAAYSQRPLWAPSPVPEVATREVPKVMEAGDIGAVVAGFGTAARIALASGMDGVEVNIGQFSLVRQFLSGLTNMRADGYGVDRLRFAREVLAAVRAAVGPDGLVALRLCVDEMAPWAGIVPEAGAELASALVDAGVADLVTVVRGSIYTAWATRPDGHVEPGFAIEMARRVRSALAGRVPVVAQGSIVEWGQAEWVIESGAADAVEMTRAQLADAELVAKLRRGEADQVRPCVLCNQTCKVRDNRNPIITCVVDPRTGHEIEDAESAPVDGGALTVIGGGVAGLEAARAAANRGFSVRVVERGHRLGGVVRAAATGSGRSRLGAIADWLEAECGRLGVTIELGRSMSDDELAKLTGEILVATGGIPASLPFVIDEDAVVMHAVEVLEGAPLPAGPIAVWDPLAGPIAISVAERLAGLGRSVTLITPDLLVGEKLSLTGDLAPAQGRLHGAGITLVKRALVRRVSAVGVRVEDRFSGAASSIDAVAFVACGHRVPDASLDPDERFPQAGDRVAPRTIHEAILEGRRAAGRLIGMTRSPGSSLGQ